MNNVQTIMLLLGVGMTLITVLFVFGIRGLYLRNGNASDDSDSRKNASAKQNSNLGTLRAPEPHDAGDAAPTRESPSIKDTWIARVAKGPRTRKFVTTGGGRVSVTPPLESDGDEAVLHVLEDAAHQVRTHLKNRRRVA